MECNPVTNHQVEAGDCRDQPTPGHQLPDSVAGTYYQGIVSGVIR